MKCRLTQIITAALVCVGFPSCNGVPPVSFSLGFTGTTSMGQDYTFGLNIPMPTFAKKAVPVPEPPLPETPGGKTPVLLEPAP